MKRREFITLLGGAAAVWPITVLAQQSTMPVGHPHSITRERSSLCACIPSRSQGSRLRRGQNVAVEYRWAYGQYDRMPELAKPI
ncbi:MAG: hypothetical protein WA712_16470 [Pseudolabrys sp.]